MYILLGCGLWLCPARGQEPVGIPDAYTGTPDSLAFYIDSHYVGDAAKLEALYRWITSKMSYNVYPMFTSVNERLTEEEEVCRTLRAREGVCRHFAQVFCMVGERMDIPAFKVDGYVKSGGVVMPEPHSWCVALVDGRWYNYDPTYGMGYVSNHRFVSAPNDEYCQVEPCTFLQTHMPFDPMWQFLPHPYSYPDFDEGTPPDTSGPVFDYADTLRTYLSQTPLQRLVAVNGRVRRTGRPNRLVDYFVQLNTSNIGVLRQNAVYDLYKKALKHYNRGVDNFNEVVLYQRANRRIGKDGLRQMLGWIDEAAAAVDEARQTLDGVKDVPEQYVRALDNLKAAVADTSEKVRMKRELLLEDS